jgi:hypothetical protein
MTWWPCVVGVVGAATLLAAFVRIAGKRPAWHRPLNQFFGGLNVAAAALLVFLTGGMFVVMPLGQFFDHEATVPLLILAAAAGLFVLLLAFAWARWGLVPHTIVAGRAWRLWLGHVLVVAGTLAYGSVTFYMPALVWLGLIESEAMAVLPWLAFVTWPLALLFWSVAFFLILGSREPQEPVGE